MIVVSRCLSAAGIRFSVIRFPPGSWALLTVGLPNLNPDPERGYHVPHARAAIGLGALCAPRTTVLAPDGATSRPASAALQRPVPAPRRTSHRRRLRLTRHQPRVHACSPVRSSLACGRPDGTGRPWASLGFAPRRPRAERRTPGQEQAIEHGPGTTRSTHRLSISNPIVHS
jgi:hypothetical protein